MNSKKHGPDGDCHFFASFIAAIVNFPLWRASAIAQSGFKLEGSSLMEKYYKAVMLPPYRGFLATIGGMTWARGIIFYASDNGKIYLKNQGYSNSISTALPPMFIGIFVQFVNMPLVRSTITIQNPSSPHHTVRAALRDIYLKRGLKGLWHGTSAGIMKTVPKYITAVAVRDWCEEKLPNFGETDNPRIKLIRSAIKSCCAGIAGAALTNPLDVIRNEMFKTELSFVQTCKKLYSEEKIYFVFRGIGSNITAVSIPIAITIFMTDVFKSIKYS